MQLPMVTIPSAWTGLGRMSQARSRCQGELGRCWNWYSSELGGRALGWLQTTKREQWVGGWMKVVAGRVEEGFVWLVGCRIPKATPDKQGQWGMQRARVRRW
jgi:hypothetical protein